MTHSERQKLLNRLSYWETSKSQWLATMAKVDNGIMRADKEIERINVLLAADEEK
jgi:hypothetical protein